MFLIDDRGGEPGAELGGAQREVGIGERRVGQAEPERVRHLDALRRVVPVADPDVVQVLDLRLPVAAEDAPRVSGSGPRIVLPGKLADDGTSSYFTGNVVASLPDGVTLPVTTSAIACPDSWPGCHASRMASGTPRQLAVSMTPPTLSTTSAFFFSRVERVGHGLDQGLLVGGQLEVALARAVAELAGVAADGHEAQVRLLREPGDLAGGHGHLGQRAGSMNGCVGGRFFVCSAMCAP